MGYKEDLEAVKQDGCALKYVEHQTQELCLEVVKQDERLLQYVNPKYVEMCKNYLQQRQVSDSTTKPAPQSIIGSSTSFFKRYGIKKEC